MISQEIDELWGSQQALVLSRQGDLFPGVRKGPQDSVHVDSFILSTMGTGAMGWLACLPPELLVAQGSWGLVRVEDPWAGASTSWASLGGVFWGPEQ